jgi:hypothetical protein
MQVEHSSETSVFSRLHVPHPSKGPSFHSLRMEKIYTNARCHESTIEIIHTALAKHSFKTLRYYVLRYNTHHFGSIRVKSRVLSPKINERIINKFLKYCITKYNGLKGSRKQTTVSNISMFVGILWNKDQIHAGDPTAFWTRKQAHKHIISSLNLNFITEISAFLCWSVTESTICKTSFRQLRYIKRINNTTRTSGEWRLQEEGIRKDNFVCYFRIQIYTTV